MTEKLLIAGASSGVGKTTITMGLIAALRQRGLRVQPFKAGPDYIDPTYHTLAAGQPCRNIDTWMVSPERALALFQTAAQFSDIAVIEGVMGLFDGFSYVDDEGSSAQIAKLVGAPVLLVLDVGKMARSAGALAMGYTSFDPALNIAGFILNRCGSQHHFEGVKLAVESTTQRPVVGWLPKDADLHIPERHLGLIPTDERGELSAFITQAADIINTYFDIEQILTIAYKAASYNPISSEAEAIGPRPRRYATPPLPVGEGVGGRGLDAQDKTGTRIEDVTKTIPASSPHHLITSSPHPPRIAVARDAAFSFYYEDNLDLLRQAGAEICFFSPLTDYDLPPEISGLYLGGGFPEMHAGQLSANGPMLAAIRQAHANGLPIYAECGGFMVLTEAIVDLEGQHHPMVGIVPGHSQMQQQRASLGYRLVESPTGNFLMPSGMTTRGHEFHWSAWITAEHHHIPPAWHIRPRQEGQNSRPDGYAQDNLIGSYVHLHFAHHDILAQNFVQACLRWRDEN